MPNDQAHRAIIKRNWDVYDHLYALPDVLNNWRIVVLFYIAVHAVERYLWQKAQVHSSSHEMRANWIARDTGLRRIQREYEKLKDMSRDARYEDITMTEAEVDCALQLANTVEQLIDASLPS